jgi:hypothetical protein
MSLLIEQEIACVHCQHPNAVEVWSAINIKEDPELKDLLLGGEINMAECVSCKEIFYAEHFLLYHDPEAELMAFVYPHDYASEKDRWREKTAADFALSQGTLPQEDQLNYPPLTMFGLDSLAFQVEDEEEMDVQGEIVSLLARDAGLGVHKVRASVAREMKIPRVLPYVMGSGKISRDAVVAALDKIKAMNDRLTVYHTLEERIRQDPAWSVPEL